MGRKVPTELGAEIEKTRVELAQLQQRIKDSLAKSQSRRVLSSKRQELSQKQNH